MANEREVDLKIGVDATQGKQELAALASAGQKLGETVAAAGQEAAVGVKKIGDEGAASEQKLTRQQNAIRNQIQRTTAEFAAFGKSGSAYYEKLAQIKGVDVGPLQAELNALKALEAQQIGTGKAMDRMGLSAKQIQASMRGLPAQFTDIFVSLASGQPPMMVFLQQGGQIKDMFGGIGAAAKAMGTLLWSLITPLTIGATAIGVLAYGFAKGREETTQLNLALLESGNMVGTTVPRLTAMAAAMDRIGTTQGKATDVLDVFVRTGRVAADELQRFSMAAIELERAGGPAIAKTAEAFADLGKDPLKSVIKLNEAMNFLTPAMYEQIRALEQTGDMTGAARMAQDAYAKAIEERTPEMIKNLGLVSRAWLAIKDVSKEVIDAIMGIGRAGDPLSEISNKIRAQESRVANLQRLGPGVDNARAIESANATLNSLRQQQAELQEVARLNSRIAGSLAEQAERTRAMDRWYKDEDQYLSKKVKMEREIAEARRLGELAGKSEEEIQKRIAAIREKFKEKGAGGDQFADQRTAAKEWASFYEKGLDLLTKSEAKSADLSKSQTLLLEILKNPAFAKWSEGMRQAVLSLMYAAIASEDLADQQARLAKDQAEYLKQEQKFIDAYTAETAKITEKANKIRDETNVLGLNAEAKAQLLFVERQLEINRMESWATDQLARGATEEDLLLIRQRIDALRDLNAAELAHGQKKQTVEEAKDVEKEWVRVSESISNALTDALMRGFDKGKGFLQNLVDSIKNAFKTLVIKLMVEPVVKSIVGTALGAVGLGAAGAAAASEKSSGITGLSSIANLWTKAGTLGETFALSGVGQTLGLSTLSNMSVEGAGLIAPTLTGAGEVVAMMGQAVPWIAAAYAIYSIISANKSHPAIQNFSTANLAGQTNLGGWFTEAPNLQSATAYDEPLKKLTTSIADAIKKLGGTANAQQFAIYTSASPDNKGEQVYGRVTGGNVDYTFDKNVANEDAQKTIEDALQRMFIAGLQGADLAKPFADFFAKVDLTTATKDDIDAMIALASQAKELEDALTELGGVFAQLPDMTVEARTSLIELFGGLSQMGSAVSTYFDRMYTAEEKLAIQTKDVTAVLEELNLGWVDTRAEFRDVVDSLNLTDEADRRLFVSLMKLVPAFTAVIDASETTAAEIKKKAEEEAKVRADAIAEIMDGVNEIVDADAIVVNFVRALDLVTISIDDLKASMGMARNAYEAARAVQYIGGAFSNLANMSVEARDALVQLTGGISSFTSKVNSYIEHFYSDPERAGITARGIVTNLQGAGIETAGLDTMAEFKDLMTNALRAGDSPAIAALLNTEDAFTSIADYLKENNTNLDALANTAPVDYLTLVTQNGQSIEQGQLGLIDSGIQGVRTGIDQVVIAVNRSAEAIGAIVSNAIGQVANRPINVIVNMQPPAEVNSP
jgi:phage-related minor tail protein